METKSAIDRLKELPDATRPFFNCDDPDTTWAQIESAVNAESKNFEKEFSGLSEDMCRRFALASGVGQYAGRYRRLYDQYAELATRYLAILEKV